MLPPVVVTASRVEQPQTDALPHTTVITAEDIRNNPAADLPSLLQREAGIAITQNGGPGQPASLFMRGAQPGETLILIDGVPIHRQAYSASPALEHILPEQIDHIEIVRGNVSAIYGSGAIGGVIQIFTKQGTGPAAFDFSTEVGARGTRQVTGGVSGKSGDTRYALSLTRFITDGISAMNPAQTQNVNPDKNGDRNTSFSANVSQEWDRGHEVGLRAYANDGKTSYDSGGSFASATDTNFSHSQQQTLTVFSKDRIGSIWTSTVNLSQTATRNENINVSASPYTIHDNGDTTLFQWANEIKPLSNVTLLAGTDFGRDKLEDSADYGGGPTVHDYSRSTSSLYAGLNGKFDVHQIQLNVRRDTAGYSGSDTTGYLGYGYELSKTVKLIASASTAFNAPTLIQIYDPTYGNQTLKAEHARTYEVGAQYAAGRTLLRSTIFDTKTRNQFSYDPNTFQTINVDQASNRGFEWSATSNIANTDVHASLTLQNPRDEIHNEALIRRAKTMAGLSASKAFDAWRLGTDVQYTGRRPDNNNELGSYCLVNANARYFVRKNLSVYGRIENVFNHEYETAYGYNQPPRGVFVGLNWQP
jgi:vitamin B12 transporter